MTQNQIDLLLFLAWLLMGLLVGNVLSGTLSLFDPKVQLTGLVLGAVCLYDILNNRS
jgi:hypothetical protein